MTKKISTLVLFAAVGISQGTILNFDLSPPGTDKAVGLSSLNETPAVTNSTGSGNEIGTGITFDTDTLTLSLSIGYGSAYGFTDLTGPATLMHIHGPAPTNVSAGVLIDLAPLHTPATNPATGGLISGTVVYTADQAAFLLAGSNYVNIHTVLNGGGEIRGQLVPQNAPPTITCPAPATFECDGSGGRLVSLSAQVADADGDPLTVVWTVDGAPVQTNNVPAGGPPTSTNVTLSAFLTLGQHPVVISISDGKAGLVTCSTTEAVVDTIPPTIVSATASPNVLWPPNHKMINCTISVTATDICSSVTSRIKTVTSNEPIIGPGKGKPKSNADWKATGPLTVQLRAERLGRGNGRTYTVTIECTDTSGNSATKDVIVRVPHDQRPNNNPGNGNGNSGNGNGNNGNGSGNGNSGNNGNNGNNGNGRGNGKKG
jgi:hypothetical protein